MNCQCGRLEGVPYPFRVDDFPGFGDVNDISTGLTAVAYDLSAIQVMLKNVCDERYGCAVHNNPMLRVQVVVIQFDAAQREDTVILLAQVCLQ